MGELWRRLNFLLNRRRLERELAENMLDSLGDAVLSTDIAGHVTYLNAVAEKMTGRARGNP